MKSHITCFSFLCGFEVLRIGLWAIWLCGFVFIAISFYATTVMLPSSVKDQILMMPKSLDPGFSDVSGPRIEFFSAPKPFTGSGGNKQAVAVKSWLGLSSDIRVVLFSQHPSVFSFAAAFGTRVSVEPNIDFTFLGTPFFHSMIARAQASTSDISVLIDPEIVVLPEFSSILNHVVKLDHDWLLVASSRNVSYIPFNLDADGKHWLSDEGKQISTEKLQEFLGDTWQWNHCEEKMILAWNNGEIPLHSGVLPPFLYRKGLHDHWVINEALSSDFRFVFDASWIISNFYVNDFRDGSYQPNEDSGIKISDRSWESIGNSYLAALYGSLYFYEAKHSNMVKLCKCDGQYYFVNTAEDIVYPLQNHRSLSIRKEVFSESRRSKTVLDCISVIKSQNKLKDCSMKVHFKLSTSLSLPFSLELLLSECSDQTKTIVLAVAGYSYKDMLMSWVCRMRHLLISNFLIGALDQETYEFSVLQGLPVFKDSFALADISFDDCHFGTSCFQKVTKVKSRVVVQILKLGYNVLMTDVDVYWFKNPLPLLYSFGPAVLVAQSDEYNITGPINLPRRLNSGFYYAHSDVSTITALEKVVKHAASSNLSEQPSFYDILCGEGGSYRVGDDRCLEPETNLTVQFLNRYLFPNGAYQGLWNEKNVEESCLKKGCLILHNNWIGGRRKKLERQEMLKTFAKLLGLVHSDRDSRRKKALGGAVRTSDLSLQLKDITVRIVHAGGREELYQSAVPASWLIEKYPGMCIARPEVFKKPYESILSAEEQLLPGKKYYIIPSTTVGKLKRRNSLKGRIEEPSENKESLMLVMKAASNLDGEDYSDESVSSAKAVSKERRCSFQRKKSQKLKKPFVPPIQKPNVLKTSDWEPSLVSIIESP